MTREWRNRTIGLGLAAAVYLLDQWIKALALGPWRLRDVEAIELLPFFDLRWTQNLGVSLGMFEATSPEMRWGLVAVTGLIALVVFVWMLRERAMGEIAGLALILGGAMGNIRDRYQYGYVIDYADFHIGTFRPFLVFNVADAAITIGVLIILARALFMREKPPAPHGENDSGPQAEQPADPSAENS
jgi:signal peptidase II